MKKWLKPPCFRNLMSWNLYLYCFGQKTHYLIIRYTKFIKCQSSETTELDGATLLFGLEVSAASFCCDLFRRERSPQKTVVKSKGILPKMPLSWVESLKLRSCYGSTFGSMTGGGPTHKGKRPKHSGSGFIINCPNEKIVAGWWSFACHLVGKMVIYWSWLL